MISRARTAATCWMCSASFWRMLASSSRTSRREAANHARLRGDIKIISAANANSLISNMSSLLNLAVNE